MWRMNYTILINLWRLPKILETMHRMADRPDLYSDKDGYDYVRYIVSLMQKTGHIKTQCFGEENLPKSGGYVMYPNHQGKYDAYGLVSVSEDALTIVMDREKSYHALINEIIQILRGKRMDVDNARQALTIINQVAQEVSEGRRYIIFPEGAYSDDKHNELWDFKPGCFKAAAKACAPIVPVALVNSYKVYNSWTLLPVKTQVHYLQPLYYEDYKDLNTAQISEIVKERIANKLNELKKN